VLLVPVTRRRFPRIYGRLTQGAASIIADGILPNDEFGMMLSGDICDLPAMNPSDGNFIGDLFASEARKPSARLGGDSDGDLSSGSE
jgi:hypothetical protein